MKSKFFHIATTIFLAGVFAVSLFYIFNGDKIGIIGVTFSVVALFYQFVNIMLDEIE